MERQSALSLSLSLSLSWWLEGGWANALPPGLARPELVQPPQSGMTSLKHNWGKTARNADFLSLLHPRLAPQSNRTCDGGHISAGISAPLEKSGAKFHSQALSPSLPSAGIDFSFGGAGRSHHTMALAPFIHLVVVGHCPVGGRFPTGFRSPIARSSPSVTQTIGGHGQ